MKVRDHPLPPDLQYVLDGGVEYGHITGGAHVACFLFADIAELDRVHSIPHPGTRGWASTAAMCVEVEKYGQSLIAQIDDPALKAACLGATTTSFLRAIADYGEYVCGQAFEDALWGGSMIHMHEHRVDRHGRIHRRLAGRLRSERFVRRAIRRHRTEDGYVHLIRQAAIIGNPLPPATEAGFELLNQTLNAQRRRSDERNRQWVIDHRGDPVLQPDEVKVKLKPGVRRQMIRAKAKQRRAIIRAATIASAILGASAVSAFARGEPVRLPADDLVFEIALGGPLSRVGHSALAVTLKDPGDVFLAKMCIYQDLPALDQLASLALHVQSGGAADVLAAGNLFNPSPAAFAHPMLAGKKPPPPPHNGLDHGPMLPMPPGRRFHVDWDTRRAMIIAHEDVMGDRYRHRLFVEVMGRGAPAAWATFEKMRARERPQE